MNALKNKVILIGNLGNDPEIKNLDNEKSLARFSLATSEMYYNKEGNKVTDTQWHTIVCWNSTAKNVEKFLKKGSLIIVEGKLNNRNYEDKDGNKKYVTEVVCNEFMLLK